MPVLHLIGRWRQTEQIEIRPADQHSGRSLTVWLQSQRLLLRANKMIDGCARPLAVFNHRRSDRLESLERPELSPGRDVDLSADGCGWHRARVGGAQLDPFHKIG